MTKVFSTLIVLAFAQNAAAVKFENADFVGRRIMVVDQAKGEISGVLSLDTNTKARLQANTTNGEECHGNGLVEETDQTIEARVMCKDGQSVQVTITLSNTDEDVVYLLQGGLTSATAKVESNGKVLFSGPVEIKRLGK